MHILQDRGPRALSSARASGRQTHAVVTARASLWRIHQPNVNVCAWARPLRGAPWSELSALVAQTPLFEHEVAVTLEQVSEGVCSLVRAFPTGAARAFVSGDLQLLLKTYFALFNCEHAHAYLELIDRDACRFFHRDNVSVRMICTYVGPGTEWAPRAALLDPDMEDEQAPRDETGLRVRPSQLRHGQPGEVILLKGKKWPGAQVNAAVHRSPPIAAAKKRRLVLRIDRCAHTG